MSPVVEEPEDYEEFIDENQEDNHTRNSTTYGGSNWRGNPYAPPPCMRLLRKSIRLTYIECN